MLSRSVLRLMTVGKTTGHPTLGAWGLSSMYQQPTGLCSRVYSNHSHPPPAHKSAKPEHKDLHLKSDDEILNLLVKAEIPPHNLESVLKDNQRAVNLRRQLLEKNLQKTGREGEVVEKLPYKGFEYEAVVGACCENVIGYIGIPVGIAGPLRVDGEAVYVPMATTEGALVASTHRGCKAITESGMVVLMSVKKGEERVREVKSEVKGRRRAKMRGIDRGCSAVVHSNGMTRAPVLKVVSVKQAAELKEWLERPENFYQVAAAFNSTSRFARLASIKTNIAGRYMYMRFKSSTGDAMGMNMVSKGVEKALAVISQYFPEIQVMSLSGNFCTDKKPAAVNWIEGRGKSVVCEAVITEKVVKDVLKTSVDALVELNMSKNLIGSAIAGSVDNHRRLFDHIASQLDITHLDQWYSIKKNLIKMRFPQCETVIRNHYGNSMVTALMMIYPHHKWQPWRFDSPRSKLWDNVLTRKLFFDHVKSMMNVENDGDWTKITREHVAKFGGGWMLFHYYGGSVNNAVREIYGINLGNKMPHNAWDDAQKHKDFFDDWFYRKNGRKNLDQWYDVTIRDMERDGGHTIVKTYYQGSLSRALIALYPQHRWQVWKFKRQKVPKGFWDDKSNVMEYARWLSEKLHITSPQSWQRVSSYQVKSNFGGSLVTKWGIQKLVNDWSNEIFPVKSAMKGERDKRSSMQVHLVTVLMEMFSDEIFVNHAHPILSHQGTRHKIELDVFVPSHSLAFEYHGAQHYWWGNVMGSPTQQQTRDIEKHELCEMAGIKLIEVPHWWDGSVEGLKSTIRKQMPSLTLK